MSDFTIKAGSYCPVCRGITLCDCGHTIQQLDERPYRRDALDAARNLAAIAERKNTASDARIKRLESAVQAMAAAIRPLLKQGEDHIWRPVQRALNTADDAILDRFPEAMIDAASSPNTASGEAEG